MRLVRYDGPGALLRVAGREIPRGETGEIPNHDAERLLETRGINITDLGDTKAPQAPESPEVTPPADSGEPEADGEGHPQTNDDEQEN